MSAWVRRVGPDDWRDWRVLRLRSLREDPSAFSSSTTAWTGSQDTEDRWRTRLADGACFIAYAGATPVGMVAGMTGADGTNQLISMWVAPEARRQGIGAELIDAVVAWNGNRPLSLRVIDGNVAAIRAYEDRAFVMVDGDADAEGCRTMVRAGQGVTG